MGMAQLVILGLMAVSVVLGAWAIQKDTAPVWRFAVPKPVQASGAPVFATIFDYETSAGQAHSPSIVIKEDGLDVMWFEGSEEAQADVDIHFAGFQKTSGGWHKTASGTRITRAGLGAVFEPRQLVVTLGNTLDQQDGHGGIYATVVSVGGWAMASVADVAMGPEGPTRARKLNLSPFLNRSHLVKSPVVPFTDGTRGLPAYFEMGAAHGVLARLDAQGRVRDTVRIAGAGKPIQPMIVPLDEMRAVAWLRDFEPSGQLLTCRTADGGKTWSEVAATDMPNPSAPVAALALGAGRILMAANDDPSGQDRMRLLLSDDEGASWRVLQELEPNGAGARYPMLQTLQGGEIVLAYSVGNKQGLRVHVLNAAWVAAQ
ncbi:MAG: exo-alpha-sialidase [Pseudomonadota bacterium]